MNQPRWVNVQRYTHCDPIDVASGWDGVALLWYRSEDARRRHVADAAAREIMRADEADTFARPVRDFATLVHEHVYVGSVPGTFKRFRFVWRPASLGRAEFHKRWRQEYAPRQWAALSAQPGFSGRIENLARAEADVMGFGLDCDVIEETDWTELLPETGEEGGFGRLETLWTRETVLFEAKN
jgi:hypothetical protein